MSLLVAVVLTLASPSVEAQELSSRARDELARSHFRAGSRAFDERRFADAALEFERVVEYAGQSDLLFNVARSWELADEPTRAVRAWQRFLDAGAPGMDRNEVRASLTRLRPLAEAREHANCAPSSATRPTTNPTATTPGNNASSSSVRAGANAGVPPGQLLQLRTREVYEQSTVNIAGPFVLLGVGAVFAGLAAWQLGALLDHTAQVEQATRTMNPERWTVERSAAYLAIPREQTGAITLGAAAGTALVGGVLWLALRGPGERREQVVRASNTRRSPLFFPVFQATETHTVLGLGGVL